MAKNRVWGQTRIRVNGRELDTEGKSQLELGGPVRTAQQADHKAGFYSEETMPSKVTCSVLVTEDVSLAEMRAWDDVTVSMEADTGQTYVVSHAYVADMISVSEGKASLVLQGPPAEELKL